MQLLFHLAELGPNFRFRYLNSSPPNAIYMCQWTESALVSVMTCRLFGAKPLPEPMLVYCQMDSWEQTSVKFKLEFYHFRSGKCIWNCRLPKWRPFCPGGDELTPSTEIKGNGIVKYLGVTYVNLIMYINIVLRSAALKTIICYFQLWFFSRYLIYNIYMKMEGHLVLS